MLNKHYMLIIGLLALLFGPISAFAAGYFNDKQCTLEESKTGRCDRLNDGTNNILGWLSNASWVLCFMAAAASFGSVLYHIIYFFDKSVKCWGNRTQQNNHPSAFNCTADIYMCPEK